MLNIFADALLIATRMDNLPRKTGASRPRPETARQDKAADPQRRLFTLMGVRL